MNDRGFEAERLDTLRQDFDTAFDRGLVEAHLARLPAWFERNPSSDPFETTIQSWIVADGMRVMVLQETEAEDVRNFRWFFKRTGHDYDIEMLQIDIRNVDRHVPFIVECYRRWLIDREGEASVDAFIERYVGVEG
jgi:hypothetical protein